MKYYSEKLSEAKGKPAVFGTQKELEEAEKAFDGQRALEARKADERKADAKKVEEAYRHSLDVLRKATKERLLSFGDLWDDFFERLFL